MFRVIGMATTAAAAGVLGFGMMAGTSSAHTLTTATAHTAVTDVDFHDCKTGTRSVHCKSNQQASEWMKKYCIGSNGDAHCSGVGRQCATQDNGIICEQTEGTTSDGRHPHGPVSAGAGGTWQTGSPALLAAGAGIAGLGGVLLLARRRRAEQS
ncbi:LPXTG cell wall anchor domain-containing protein [Actinomadura rupiterrae]|uniref:LPXTG cell wall anchor domain-containing protein n=1 Tax=Actinomadura rupiterrae TaxID=559627 RepID=UPI0020A2F7E0|nr:LPXTG cell wall anchor domain-containing protein [Actinomadura rupiterrae]MCP2335240.1 LPXTG-motif cell wall-anchored protein [Actinomadura rupiterrae]